MKYDLEIVVPVSSKYEDRIEDFKKYGVFSSEKHKVLVTPIMSGEKIRGIEEGWRPGVVVKSAHYENQDFISNIYRYFLDREPESRWIMKLDDDSCTDVGGLLSNLDRFYSSDEKIYLATSLVRFVGGKEFELRKLYEKFLGRSFVHFSHELEMSIISSPGLRLIRSSSESSGFLEERCKMAGGATDIALAYAAILAKVHPTDLPFATHLPLLNELSLFGGYLNHIHMVSRSKSGENFHDNDRCGDLQYEALVRAVDGKMTEIERSIAGKMFLMDGEHELALYAFYEDRTARIKFDGNRYIWVEFEGAIHMFSDPRHIQISLFLQDDGCLKGKIDEREVLLVPVKKLRL